MDLREHRGMELAATRTIQQKAGIWIVPSQAGKGTYRVHLMPKVASCTCPDHETRGVDCKHIFAARFVMRRERNADGSTTVTEERHHDGHAANHLPASVDRLQRSADQRAR